MSGDEIRTPVNPYGEESPIGMTELTLASQVLQQARLWVLLVGVIAMVVAILLNVPSFGGQQHILGYHMWTQFLIDGQWYDFDAALGHEVAPHPGRIAVAGTSLRDSSHADISIPLLSKIGNLKVEILDTK